MRLESPPLRAGWRGKPFGLQGSCFVAAGDVTPPPFRLGLRPSHLPLKGKESTPLFLRQAARKFPALEGGVAPPLGGDGVGVTVSPTLAVPRLPPSDVVAVLLGHLPLKGKELKGLNRWPSDFTLERCQISQDAPTASHDPDVSAAR